MITVSLIVALIISSIWLAYIGFFNSRLQGLCITWILRNLGYIKDAEVKFGSISVSVLGGKIMFRELKYISKDYAIRCVDGALIFKWFTRLSPDDISRESQTWSLYHIIFQSRALLTLHGLEVHIYNRTSLYDDLEKIAKSDLDVGVPEEGLPVDCAKTPEPVEDDPKEDKWGLRNLIPVLVVEVQKGKLVVGNSLTETVMFVDIETATAIYSTPSTKSPVDPYMHMLRSKISKMRVTLNQSPEYKGLHETPPSQSKAGVSLLVSREVRLQYVQDIPGRVTSLQRSAESSPEWEMTIKFMRETTIYYGPWLDRQRDILYKFFYPPDYKVAEVSKPLKVGDLRRHQHLNIIIDFEAKATLTILFFRDEETSSIHLHIANGSRIQLMIPWTISPQGFTTHMVADLYKVQCQTSLEYSPLFDADEVHIMMQLQYPRVWHKMQTWMCDFTVCRPVVHFVFDHVFFITDLLDDWSPTIQPDLLSFVPYVWNFAFKFTDVLVILPVSQHNWVDSMQTRIDSSETVFFGLHAEMMDISFTLPWTNFQPITTELRFDINADDIVGSIWLPKYHTLRDSLKQFNMGKIPAWLENQDKGQENSTEQSASGKEKGAMLRDLEGWEECWSLQDLFIRFTFLSNSVVPYERPGYKFNNEEKTNHLGVEVMLGPSVMRLHGIFFRHLWFFKDNYFGYDDQFTPLAVPYNRAYDKNKTARVRRPAAHFPLYDLDITCKVIVKDILGEFPRHCDGSNVQVKLPCAQVDMIEFELFKDCREAKMELTISPITFLFVDGCKRPTRDIHLGHGFLQMQGVQVAMCALYSSVGINNPKNPFDFLEYGFLVEVTCGPLVGKLTVPHIQQLVHWLEIFLWQALDRENEMPKTEHQMNIERVHSSSHKVQNNKSAAKDFKVKSNSSQQQAKKLPTEDLKYLMVKVSLAHADLYVVEAGCACSIATKTVRIALCNAHDETSTVGVTVVLQGADVTQYVRLPHEDDKPELESRSQWLQAGVVSLPPVMCDINKRLANPGHYKSEQREFLKIHDKINQRLLFLWLPEEYKGCGCVGGVTFNNTSLVEVNGFYFEPLCVPQNFCQSAQNSNTPWKTPRGATQVEGSLNPSPGSSISSRQSIDKRKHISDILTKEGFGGLSPRPNSLTETKKQKPPPAGKKKNKSGSSSTALSVDGGFTTFPPRGGKKRDKQKTLSQYNDLLKNFSIKRNLSRMSYKRKSKGSDIGSEQSVKVDKQEEVEEDGRPTLDSTLKAADAPEAEEEEEILSAGPIAHLEGESVHSSTPSICITTETPAKPPPQVSSESIDGTAPYESATDDESNRRSSKYSLPPQSPISSGERAIPRPGSAQDDARPRSKRISRGVSGTLSRSSSQDSFHSAKSGWRTGDGASSAGEDKDGLVSSDPEEEPVKDLCIPFPFPAAADSALNHELIDIYREHLPKAWLTETRYSNTVVLNKSYNDIAQLDSSRIPHRVSSFHGSARKGSDSKVPPVAPCIHQLLQLVKYTLPDYHSESGGSTSSVTSENLFSVDSISDNKPDPKLMDLRRRWERKLKEKKVVTSEEDLSVQDTSDHDQNGKVILMAEIIDPVDIFFTPFCVHAVNKYIETAEAFYRDLHPAAVINIVQAATAPTVLEIAIQHATAQKALLFSNHLQLLHVKKFDNSLERTIEERLNLELFLKIPAVSVRTLQGGGDLQWVGTETELESARFKAGTFPANKDGACTTTDDEGPTERSESVKSDASGCPSSSGAGSSNVICPSKIAKLSLVKFVANNIDLSFGYHQFEKQKPITSPVARSSRLTESMPPGEYTQTAFKASVQGIYGQLHILHPLIGYHSDTFIPYSKTRVVMARNLGEHAQKFNFSNRNTSVVFEFGAERCCFSGATLKRNLLVALPEPPEQQKPKTGKKDEDKHEPESFALDKDSIDIEAGNIDPKSVPFKYKKLKSKASIHYHSGADKRSINSSLDDAQEPLISEENSSSEDILTNDGIEYRPLESEREEDGVSSERVSMGAEVAATLSAGGNSDSYHDKSSVNGQINEFWVQIATPSEEQTDPQPFNPYSSLPHAVFSWSEPGSLLAQHASQLSRLKLSRVQSVIAALLAEALGQEVQYEPPIYTTKHSRFTVAANTLKASAVIRLMNQLRYTLNVAKDPDTLYHDLLPDYVPRRIILERGIQSMLAAIEGNLLQTADDILDNISQYPSNSSANLHAGSKDPSPIITDKTPVYYVGSTKQDYGSIKDLDNISIGKPPQFVQSEAKHRTHRHALVEMLSSKEKAKLADKYFALYQALNVRLPKTDHVNHQLKLGIMETSILAIDCHREVARIPFFQARNLALETSLFPAQKEFSIPRMEKNESGGHRRAESKSSTTGSNKFPRSESATSLNSRQSGHSGTRQSSAAAAPPPRPPRKKKSKKVLTEMQAPHNIKKSITHVVKHLVINMQCESCKTEINLDLLRLTKALVDGMSNFQPGSFHPVLGESAGMSDSGPPSPTADRLPRSAEDQFMLSGAWEKMHEYVQLMFRGDHVQQLAFSESSSRKPRLDRDLMLYSEAPDIPLSVTATWCFDRAEIVGMLQGLRALITVGSICGAAAILQNLYVEMTNSPNSDIILEPLSPNIISGVMNETQVAVHFYDEETKEDIQLICVDIPALNTVYSFLPHVTRIQKMFVNIAEFKAKVPKPIVDIKKVLLVSMKLVMHELKSFDRYFQRPQQSLQRIHIESHQHPSEIDLNLLVRSASFDLDLLPSLSLKHEMVDFHIRFAQSKVLTAQLDIHGHELSLDAAELELHTHLPLPQIFIKGEKVKKRDVSGARSGISGEHYTGVVEIKTVQLHLPTTMLNHVLMVQNAFMKEINEFLDTINLIRSTIEKTNPIRQQTTIQPSPTGVLFAFTMKLHGIDLLATTPSDLAMSLKTETINVEVKNRMVTEHINVHKDRQQIIERPRMFISTSITTDITLGQLADLAPGIPRSSEEDMSKFLQFRATASLGNDEGLFENKLSPSESFHATISNPQLFMQPGAFDKALLFYLNYKRAYAIFNDDRQKLNSEAVMATETFKNRFNLPEGPPDLPTNTQLKVTVKNLALCLPIQQHTVPPAGGDELLSASQINLVKYASNEGALSISIRTAEMKMNFGSAHINDGHFNDFVVRFIDDFEERRWMENAAPRSSEKEMNSISIDYGKYKYVTRTDSVESPQSMPTIDTTVSTLSSDPAGECGKMTVSVVSDIKGANVHLNTKIISRLVCLYKTLTSLVGVDDVKDDMVSIDESDLVKNLEDQPEEVTVAIWKKKTLQEAQRKKDNMSSIDRVGSGKKRKKPAQHEADATTEVVSMYSTRTSKSPTKDGSNSSTQLPIIETPTIEFTMYLDVRLGNGKITLYPASKTEESFNNNSKGSRKYQRFNDAQDYVTDNTEFLIPETECNLHYSSTKSTTKTGCHNNTSTTTATTSSTSRVSAETTGTTGSDESAKAVKTGTLFSAVKVLSLKSDQIIRPCLLEFLDQLLTKDKSTDSPSTDNPLQSFIPDEIEEILKEPKRSRQAVDEPKTSPSPSSEHSSSYKHTHAENFPIDIIIDVTVEPSTIKLSCQPYSRHECSLQIPRSRLLLSTKGTPAQAVLTAATGRKEVTITRDGSTSCWNLTWSLEQCKLSLYHPLGVFNYQQGRSLPGAAEVRNALSVTIDGGNVAVTRITIPKELTNSEGVTIPGHNPKRLIAHVSAMLDIGKVDLTYDIKRMDEVESFHNAWLSGSFIKRLLLLSRPIQEAGETVVSSPASPNPENKMSYLSRSDRFYSISERPSDIKYRSLAREIQPIKEESPTTKPSPPSKPSATTPASTVTTKSSEATEVEIAETNLKLAINCREVTLTTNLGHTLGRINISIANSKVGTTLTLKERHNEHRKVDILIGGVLLESSAGLITGQVHFENLGGLFKHVISPDCNPKHMIRVVFESFETKIDYLSTCIHMLRMTGFTTELNDEWRQKDGDCDLRVGGSVSWDVIQTMVTCSTAPSLLQIKAHLDEFILHQKKYSERAILRIFPSETKETKTIPLKQYEREAQVLAHHWFWAVSPHSPFESIKVLLQSGQFVKPLKLGGSLNLAGEQFSVAVFQGEKFKDDTWALVNLSKIGMSYHTTVEEVMRGTNTGRVTKQQAVISMGDYSDALQGLNLKAPNNNIGSVEKCVRSTKLSPPDRTDDIKKWLQYACTHDFAHGNPNKERPSRATIFGGGSVEFSTIFQLPEMRLNLTTEHNWDGITDQGSPASSRSQHHLPIPTVTCRLKSNFRGSIGLATNAGNYFFLHDLAQRYTKKMELHMQANPIFLDTPTNKGEAGESNSTAATESSEENQRFTREFICEEWELKPPLRLQGGGKVEVNVDWVLNKLGFKNPTVTIPKWIQRGPMDPLDYVISMLVKTLVFQQGEIVQELKGIQSQPS